MKVVITDYQYPNIDQEKKIIAEAGFELFDYQNWLSIRCKTEK